MRIVQKKPHNYQNKNAPTYAIVKLKVLAMTDLNPFLVRIRVFTQAGAKANVLGASKYRWL